MIYLCFPNNPTGAAITKDKLQEWVDYANKNGAVIIYDAAYEAYITEEDVPHSIYECEGSKNLCNRAEKLFQECRIYRCPSWIHRCPERP